MAMLTRVLLCGGERMRCPRNSSFSFSAIPLEIVGTMLSDSHLTSQLACTGVRCGLLPARCCHLHHLRGSGRAFSPQGPFKTSGSDSRLVASSFSCNAWSRAWAWEGAACQLEQGSNRRQMRPSRTPAKAGLPVSAPLLQGSTDPADHRCRSLTTAVRTGVSGINSLPFKTNKQAEV